MFYCVMFKGAYFSPTTRTLSQNNLSGTIPESLGSLPGLINMYVK